MTTEDTWEYTVATHTIPVVNPIVPAPRFRDAQPAEQLAQLVAALLLVVAMAALALFTLAGLHDENVPLFDRTNVVEQVPTKPPVYDDV